MKKSLFYFAVMTVLLSCSNDENDFVCALKSNDRIIENGYEGSNIACLNEIPSSIKQRMSEREQEVFDKLSSVFYIDYSFLDSAYYRNNMIVILSDLEKMYDVFSKRKTNPKYFTILSSQVMTNRRMPVSNDVLTVAEIGENSYYACATYYANDQQYSFSELMGFSKVSDSYQSDYRGSSVQPSDYSFHGNSEMNISSNVLRASADGYLMKDTIESTKKDVGRTEFEYVLNF